MIVDTFAPLPSGCQCTASFLPPAASLAVVPSVSDRGGQTRTQTWSLHQSCVSKRCHFWKGTRLVVSERQDSFPEVVVYENRLTGSCVV